MATIPEAFALALELQPGSADTYNHLGTALKDQGRLADAAACYRQALQLDAEFPEAHNNLGNVLKNQGQVGEALQCYRRALDLKPDYAEAHSNLGTALTSQLELDAALACFQRAVELKPDYAEAHWNRSLLWLLTGNFAQGWPEYEWRWQTSLKQFARRPFSQPTWAEQPLQGKTLLLHAEQGLGDTLQFIRYARWVQQLGAKVTVECQKPLLRLLATCPGTDALVGQGDPLPVFDLHVPLLSLPGIFHTSLEHLPVSIPYFFPASDLVEHWRGALSSTPGFKIGLAWQGSPTHANDRTRSVPLRCFEPLAQIPGVRLFSLQKGVGTEQLPEVGDQFPVVELGSRLDDFMDTAAVMMNLDLVIACDTAVVHLAGALGIPVWVALPFVPDWRWLLDRHDSPWYPTMRLFRQDRPGHWQGVFQRIEVALREHKASLGEGWGDEKGDWLRK